MPLSQVTLQASATTANHGPGFDFLNLALEQPSDKVTIVPISRGVKIEVVGLSVATISTAPEKNTGSIVSNQMLKEFSLKAGVLMKIEKVILPCIDLGSSAASAAAMASGFTPRLGKGVRLLELA